MERNAADIHSKLELKGERVIVPAEDACSLVKAIFVQIGCSSKTAGQVAEHLVDTSLCGMESHGLMRTLQYAEQFESSYIIPESAPRYRRTNKGTHEIDGGGGIGIPALHLAYDRGTSLVRVE